MNDLIAGDTKGNITVYINKGKKKAPELAAGSLLQVGGKTFECPGTRSKPEVADWNNDQLFDILVGTENGEVLLLLNTGTHTEPKFDEAAPIKGPNGRFGLTRCDPTVVDWDGDKKKDLLLADENGFLTFFPNSGTDSEPRFESAVKLSAKGWPIVPQSPYADKMDVNGDGSPDSVAWDRSNQLIVKAGNQSFTVMNGDKPFTSNQGRMSPRFVNWDDDNLPDLLITEGDGTVSLILNSGKKQEPEYKTPKPMLVNRKPFKGDKGLVLEVTDYDKDGLFDLICFVEGAEVVWYRNFGKEGAPSFRAPKKAERDASEINGGFRARVDVADVNGDKKPDLLYGCVSSSDSTGRVYLFLRD